jgi:hypothetical protein
MNFSILAQIPVLVQVKYGKYRYSEQISLEKGTYTSASSH